MKFLPADGHTGGGGGGGHGGLVAQVPLVQRRGRISNTFLEKKKHYCTYFGLMLLTTLNMYLDFFTLQLLVESFLKDTKKIPYSTKHSVVSLKIAAPIQQHKTQCRS